MGRPKELTEAEKAALRARGFRSIEIWVPDVESAAFWDRLALEGRAIRESDRRTHMNETLEAFLDDVWDDIR